MEASVDRSGCIGCGLCAETCPEVFRISDDGLAEVTAPVAPSMESSALEAMENCPVSVITIQ